MWRQIAEIAHSPWTEVAWYFPNTREQYRFSGTLRVVGPADEQLQAARYALPVTPRSHASAATLGGAPSVPPARAQARANAWRHMSEGGRSQFAWPEPGIPRLEDSEKDFKLEDPALVSDQSLPLPAFCLVIITVDEVDHLMLKENRRRSYRRQAGGAAGWLRTEVNP